LNNPFAAAFILTAVFLAAPAFAQGGVDIYSRSVSGEKNASLSVLEKRAEGLIDDGQYLQAMGVYEELLSKKPSRKKTFVYNIKLGDLAELSGNSGASLEYYKKAESLYKKNIDAKYKIGDVLFKSNLYTLSENAFLAALEIDKNSNYAKMRLGDIYFSQSLYQKALELYTGIDSYYFNEKILANTARCLRSVGKIDEALEITNNFLTANKSPQIYLLSAVLYYDKEMHAQAEEQFLNAVRLEPENFDAYVYLAGIYINDGKLEQAKKNLDKAYALDSSYCAVDLLYSQIAYKKGRIYEARRYARNAYIKAKSDFTKDRAQKTIDFLNDPR
jgi:tetratricopeptide (TPR) repeat protein